ncbi:MAG: hypothetical protein KGH72_02545 [Candidatus Micrarchaeota archaeon]|nr:hypothetical protein [Candidatus Micrarchaeota archaeon]
MPTVRPKGKGLVLMGGPCSVESERQIMAVAEAVAEAGGEFLRGGAWKPRTKGGDWEGHKRMGLKLLQRAGEAFGLKVVTEILGPEETHMALKETIDIFLAHNIAVFQVGARNAQNQELLNGLGEAGVAVLLKNGMNTTIAEWLGSATRVNQEGLMLCVRGKNNETDIARNGQDMAALAHLVGMGRYPIIFDPSHITGRRELVYSVTLGAVAMGVDGIIVEVHLDPQMSVTDSRQAITPKQFGTLVSSARKVRAEYLELAREREAFAISEIPSHVDIFFKASELAEVARIVGKDAEEFGTYKKEHEGGLLTARIPAGHMGRFRQEDWAIGKIVPQTSRDKADTIDAVHMTLPSGAKIRLSPYNEAALEFRGSKGSYAVDFGNRVELAHGFANQVVLDAYLTIEMGRVTEVSAARVVLYRPYTES